MRQSFLFTKTRKEAPKDETSKNAELLIRGGFIHKEMAGIYSYLPLGYRVLNKIGNIIREEMNFAGGQELHLSVIQDSEIWKKTNRWDDAMVDIWFKTKLKSGTELGLGFTHEETITSMLKDYIRSFRDLPIYPYQIQTKFRNETRAKSGIMRTREFLMKDLYSFSRTTEEHNAFYEKMKIAYKNIFSRVGLGDITYMTFASGGSFSKYSHEFQTVTESGEDTVHVCEKCKIAVNDEIFSEQNSCPECGNKELSSKKTVEVGNIFSLGTRFSEAMGLNYVNEDGKTVPVIMGSYGIGLGRLLGTVVEVLSDNSGIIWPESIAPFKIHLISIADKEGKVNKYANDLYQKLIKLNVEVLYDDRDLRAGEKFADSDLLGIPTRVIISEKNLQEGVIEIKDRKSGNVEKAKEEDFINSLKINK